MKIVKVTSENFNQLAMLIRKLAEYEKLNPPDQNSVKRLLHDLTKEKPIVYAYLAYENESLVGYLMTFFSYSSFLCKPTLYIEDLFVLKEYRRKGYGQKLFDFAREIAQKNNCGRMEWMALNWNHTAINFYEKNAAEKLEEWSVFRIVL